MKKIENNLLKDSDEDVKGSIKIFSTEKPFNIDITKSNIQLNEFSITESEPITLKLNIDSLDKDYTKKISIGNYDFREINKIVSINKNNEGDKALNFNYFTFEKNSIYNITIKFIKKNDNYILEKVNLLEFSADEIEKIKLGKNTYENIEDKLLIINWENDKLVIKKERNEALFFLSDLTDNQVNNIIKESQNLQFNKLKDLSIKKTSKINYSLLLVKLYDKGTQ